MRCREIQKQLERIDSGLDSIDLPDDIRAHIKTCLDCSRVAEAAMLLTHSIRTQKKAAVEHIRSFESMRDSIQKDDNSASLPRREWRLLRPAVGFAAALAVLVAALWPWETDTIIGYEVMVSGVEREYIEGSDQMCDLLMNLGLSDADIHLLGCDTTCRFHIVRLKTESEAQLVINAVSRMQTRDVQTSIRPVTDNRDDERIL